jgi:hypothetical protein
VNWEAIAKLLGSALVIISSVVEQKGSDELKAELAGLTSLLTTLRAGQVADLDEATVRAELDSFIARVMADRQGADAALAARFPDKK